MNSVSWIQPLEVPFLEALNKIEIPIYLVLLYVDVIGVPKDVAYQRILFLARLHNISTHFLVKEDFDEKQRNKYPGYLTHCSFKSSW